MTLNHREPVGSYRHAATELFKSQLGGVCVQCIAAMVGWDGRSWWWSFVGRGVGGRGE